MRRIIAEKSWLPAVFAFTLVSLAGCAGDAPHGGLVPDISGPETTQTGVPTEYSISASTDTDFGVMYGINWGDGTKPLVSTDGSASGLSGEHIWTKPGAYTITATATNGHGESGFSAVSIKVNLPPPPETDSDSGEATAAPEVLAPVPVPDKPAPPLKVIISNDPLPPLPPAPTGPLKMVVPPPAQKPAS